MTSIQKVVYCSRNLIEGDAATRNAEISQILETSRRNNSKANVTGALLFSADHFAQVLEGPQEALEAVFERIQNDTRHGDVTVLESLTSEQRDFAEWSMAYVSPEECALTPEVDAKLQDAIHKSSDAGQEVLDLLKSLVLQEV